MRLDVGSDRHWGVWNGEEWFYALRLYTPPWFSDILFDIDVFSPMLLKSFDIFPMHVFARLQLPGCPYLLSISCKK
jgi:hypothetical protein